jgi:hypothetical protein
MFLASSYAEGVREFQPSVGAKRLRWEIDNDALITAEVLANASGVHKTNRCVVPRVRTLG